eukprot:10516214-Alexandrium_andersonii.AAC.1
MPRRSSSRSQEWIGSSAQPPLRRPFRARTSPAVSKRFTEGQFSSRAYWCGHHGRGSGAIFLPADAWLQVTGPRSANQWRLGARQ